MPDTLTDPLHVRSNERETVRVFALDLPPDEAKRITDRRDGGNGDDPWPLRSALGAEALDPAHVEVFPAGDLQGVGLAGYLVDGLGIAEEDVAAERETLDAATGHIVVVHARAFRQTEQRLDPEPPLRLLGAYRQAQAAPAHATTRPVQGSGAEARPLAPTDTGRRAKMSGGTILALLILGAILILLAGWALMRAGA